MMSYWWLILPGLAAFAALAVAWPRWRQQRAIQRLSRARHLFHLRREWLEADFITITLRNGDPGQAQLCWEECEFEDEVVFASDKSSGQLRAFVGVSVALLPVEWDEEQEEHDERSELCCRNARAATAVFHFLGSRWITEGRVVFNLSPFETVERFHHDLEMVD